MSRPTHPPQGGSNQQWIEQASSSTGSGGPSNPSSSASSAGPSTPVSSSHARRTSHSQTWRPNVQPVGYGHAPGQGYSPHLRATSNPNPAHSTPTSTPNPKRAANASSSSSNSNPTHYPNPTNPTSLPPQPEHTWSHEAALQAIRAFLNAQSSYDVFPVSFRLIVLDSMLVVKKALSAMMQHGVVSAPLWNSTTSSFAGMFTVSDVIHLIQYYYHTTSYEGAAGDVDTFRLESIREIEKILHVPPPPLLSVHPMRPLFEACRLLIQTHARRLPLIDHDDQTGKEVVLSVLTQYRVLKFMAVNCRETIHLNKPLRSLGIGTYIVPPESNPTPPGQPGHNPYYPIATATMQTTVFDVVHMFSELGISAVPILDAKGRVINLYETVDVITLVRLGAYHNLDLTMSQALARRASDFPGVVTCTPDDSLASVFTLIRIRRIHRLVVVDAGKALPADTAEQAKGRLERKGTLLGIISLSDVLRHVIGDVEIGGGGVGAIPVEHVLEAQERRRQGLSSRRGSQEEAPVTTVGKSKSLETGGVMELGPSI